MTNRSSLGRVLGIALVAALLALAGGLALPGARTAQAHASLVSSQPKNNEQVRRPPARVVLQFSEAVEPKLTSIQVLDKDNKRADTNDMAFDPNDAASASVGVKPLQPGLYFVKWSNVSAVDGHNYSGMYPFIVLNPDGTVPAGVSLEGAQASTSGGGLLPNKLDSALKWLALLSLATTVGAAFFIVAVIRPAAAFLEDDDYINTTDAAERWAIALAHVLLPVAFIAFAFLVLLTVHRFATSTSIWSYLTTVGTGRDRGIQLALIAVTLAGADVLFLGNSKLRRNVGLALVILAGAAALLMSSLVSHGAGSDGKFWSVASDYVHLLASAAWLGALVMLFLFVRWRRHALSDEQGFLLTANVYDRFSVVAGLSVAAILATGTFNGLAEIPNAGAMVHTTYGRVLLTKLILLAPLLAVAGLNAFVLKPRLVATIDGLYQQGGTVSAAARDAWHRRLDLLRRTLPMTIAAEIALVVAIFAAVAVLTQTATAKGEVAQQQAATAGPLQFEQTREEGGLKLTLQVSPDRVGTNEYILTAVDASGASASTITQARLRFQYDDPSLAIPPSEVIMNSTAPGEYRTSGAYFTQTGNWRVTLGIRRTDGDDINTAFVLPVQRPLTAATGNGGAFSLPFDVFNWNEVLGAAFALAGGLALVYRREIGRLAAWGYRAAVTGAAAGVIAGAVLIFGVHTHTRAADPTAGNPVKPTQQSVDAGRALFQQNCTVCHGVDGRGDGPQAASLDPAPSDFRLHTPYHTDQQFFGFIANGYPGSAMPAWRAQFSDEDIWNLVNFLRAAFPGEASTQ
ncbi:MAG TPA: copper resistance protein CopC [Dehalococcoidia bacterium]|nr:copper resistance protein CopC [Dehalococcoidia bacterium]